ncbi:MULTISPECIES: trigger factor [unclassified Iodidimonas]|jgi:trigger factor|uniref:trigger factor n=1 Tax=unclassified Iodidimonas TaxID=2626145 RepID=UPI002482A2B6|nr:MULTISPECIES: trigger factor [unclassified Iodidimonas]
MQIDEIKTEGLSREYKITVEKTDLDQRVQKILDDLRTKVRMKGFRPGKTPLALLKKLHGEAARGQAIEETVRESTDALFRERKIRPALQPSIKVGDVEADAGFDFTVSAEILPDVDTSDFKAPALDRLVASPSDADIDAALQTLAGQSKSFEAAAKTYKAKTGDAVIIDFVGSVEGTEFEGGKGDDVQLELGSGQFIPGFEDQLAGAKAGDDLTVDVTFPENYGRDDLSGKPAQFKVSVKEVKKPAEAKIDDDFAKNFGLEGLDALKDALKTQLEQEAKALSRAKVKRALLDKLADAYDFAVPQGMVDLEYRDIWGQIKRDAIMSGEATEEELAGQDEPESEEDRKDYRDIAERRVRLGLLLSELGMANKIEINRDELMRRVAEEARRYPGQEREVFEFYTKNEQALAQLRAPLYEDKVVDFILEMADLNDIEMSLEELRKAVREEEEAEAEEADSGKKAAGKKASDKKAGSKKSAAKSADDEEKTEGKKAPAKKAAAKKAAPKKAASAKDDAGA